MDQIRVKMKSILIIELDWRLDVMWWYSGLVRNNWARLSHYVCNCCRFSVVFSKYGFVVWCAVWWWVAQGCRWGRLQVTQKHRERERNTSKQFWEERRGEGEVRGRLRGHFGNWISLHIFANPRSTIYFSFLKDLVIINYYQIVADSRGLQGTLTRKLSS